MEYKTNKIYIKDLPASLKIGKCVKSVSNVKLIRKECEDFLLVKMKNEVESACYTSQSFQTTPTHPKTLTVAPPLSAFSWISTSSFTLLQTYLTLNKRQSLSEDLFFFTLFKLSSSLQSGGGGGGGVMCTEVSCDFQMAHFSKSIIATRKPLRTGWPI